VLSCWAPRFASLIVQTTLVAAITVVLVAAAACGPGYESHDEFSVPVGFQRSTGSNVALTPSIHILRAMFPGMPFAVSKRSENT